MTIIVYSPNLIPRHTVFRCSIGEGFRSSIQALHARCTVSNAGDSSVVLPYRMRRACQQRLRMASREDYDEKDAIEQPFT